MDDETFTKHMDLRHAKQDMGLRRWSLPGHLVSQEVMSATRTWHDWEHRRNNKKHDHLEES